MALCGQNEPNTINNGVPYHYHLPGNIKPQLLGMMVVVVVFTHHMTLV